MSLQGQLDILLVDDDPGDVRRVRGMLRDVPEASPTVEVAENLAGCLERLRLRPFDVVLLDLGLPDSSSLATLQRVRGAAPRTPVVVLLGNGDANLSAEALRQGAEDYLVKGGFDGGLLLRAVRYAVERLSSREALLEAETRYADLYNRVEAGVFELDGDGRLTGANPAFVAMLGYENEAALLRLDFANDVFWNRSDFAAWFAEVSSNARVDRARLRLKKSNGEPLVGLCSMDACLDRFGVFKSYQGLVTDVTEIDRLSEQLSYEATHDSLTDLYNRRMFEIRVKEALRRLEDGEAAFALCYIDLDQFKIINDTCGHVAGDELLKHLSGALRGAMHRDEVLARLSGDEFGLLFEADGLKDAYAGAQRFLGAIEECHFVWGDKLFEVRASVGLVLLDAPGADIDELMSAADTACHVAKEQGGGRVFVGEPGAETLNRRLDEMQWVIRIKTAVNENRLLLYQQPIVSVHGARERHFELLVRKVDARGRIYTPAVFLPAVERYNLAATLDRWVVEAALRWLAENGAALGPYLCSINLSGQSLGEPSFLDFILKTLDAVPVAPQRLCFEITESAAIRNLAAARKLIAALKRRGCRFSLDDFGSGLSSFAYLRNLDVDYVKLDGVFIRSITSDAIDRAMVKSINEVVHAMGKETVAEFVENPAAIDVLRGLGVDHAQGYALGAPAPIEELLGRGRAASR